MKCFVLGLIGTIAFGQVIGTNTQVVVDYHCSGASTWQISTTNVLSGGILTNPVNDTNATLFTNATSGTRSSCITDPSDSTHHWCVGGTRQTQQALDSNYYSRALQANTQHYYQVVCSGTPQSVVPFMTSNIPSDETWNEPPDALANGTAILPTVADTRNIDFVDPKTGAQIRNMWVSNDETGNTINLYDGANKHMCPGVLVGPGPGWLCSFPADNGGPNVLYYIVQSTREIRYLGLLRGTASWSTCDAPTLGPLDDINPTNGYNTGNYHISGPCDPTGVYASALYSGHYTGDFGVTPVAPGANASVTYTLMTLSPTFIPQMVHAFDATYDTTKFSSCGIDDIFKNGYGLFECRRGIQGSYAWYAIMYIGDGLPAGSCSNCFRIIAATPGWSNNGTTNVTRWTGSHSGTMVNSAPLAYVVPGGFEGDTQGGTGAAPYLGPYASQISGAISAGTTTITVSGQPRSMSDATVEPYLQDIRVGDRCMICPASTLNGALNNVQTNVTLVDGSWTANGMRIDVPPDTSGGTEEVMFITAGGGTNSLTVSRGCGVNCAGTTPSAHANGINAGKFYNDCNNVGSAEQVTVTAIGTLGPGSGAGPGTITIVRNTPSTGIGALSYTNGANLITLGGPFVDGSHYVWWNFIADPHANTGGFAGETNPDFYGNHADFGQNIMVSEAYHTRVGPIASEIDQPTTLTIHPSVSYNGQSTPAEGNAYSRYPVADKFLATVQNQQWFTDMSGLIGGNQSFSANPGASLVAGKTQIYKYIFCTVALNNCGGTELILHRKALQTQAISGGSTLTDISGPGSVIVDGAPGDYTYCVANAANECVSGSAVGDTFANVPSLVNLSCTTNEGANGPSDLCIFDATASGGAITQYSTVPSVTGFGRRIGSSLSTYGVRLTKELAKSTPDGALTFFRSQPNKMYMMTTSSIPWITTKDSYDRTKFIPLNITLPTTGMTIPATTATATISFGYQENGGFCSSRLETCVSVTSGSVPGGFYSYQTTDTYTRLACASGCVITVPGISSRTIFMTANYYNAGGTLLRSDPIIPTLVAPAGPTSNGISALSCVGSTDVSIKCTWTTDVIADSTVSCNGNSTPTVDEVQISVSNFYGTTSHSVAITGNGLAASTMYMCSVSSTTEAGVTYNSSVVSATTNNPMTSNPVTFNSSTPWARLFDINGVWYHSDSRWYSWDSNNNLMAVGNDFTGFSNCCSNAVGVSKWANTGMTGVMAGNPSGTNSTGQSPETLPGDGINKPTTYTADGNRNFTEPIACVRGSCYVYLDRAQGSVPATLIVKSNDEFATTISPSGNTGPSATGTSFTTGVWNYPTNTSNITSNNTLLFAWESPVCQDHGGNAGQFSCLHNAGTDGWVYFTYPSSALSFAAFSVGRVRVEDIRLTDPTTGLSKYQSYAGNGSPMSGLVDTNWVPWAIGAGTSWSYATYGEKCHEYFLTGPNHWYGVCWVRTVSDPNDSTGINVWDLGRDPQGWSNATLLTNIGRGASAVHPVFPEFNLAQIATVGGGWTVQLSVTGFYGQSSFNPATDAYTPWFSTVTLNSGVAVGSTVVGGNAVVTGQAGVH